MVCQPNESYDSTSYRIGARIKGFQEWLERERGFILEAQDLSVEENEIYIALQIQLDEIINHYSLAFSDVLE